MVRRRTAGLALLLSPLAIGCLVSRAPAPGGERPAVCADDGGWRRLPEGLRIRSISGSSASAWAWGDRGGDDVRAWGPRTERLVRLVRWNGCAWTDAGELPTGLDRVSALFSDGADDVWLVAHKTAVSVWRYGRTGGRALMMCAGGAVFRRAGDGWQVIAPPGDDPRSSAPQVGAIWKSPSGKVWLTREAECGSGGPRRDDGDGGDGDDDDGGRAGGRGRRRPAGADGQTAVMRWDGTALRAVPIPDTPTAVGVWGTSDDDVWVSSPIGQVARWDGRAWQRFALPTEATIRWIGGRGPNDVWAADDQSASFHWDGRRWTAVSAFAAAGDRSDRRAGAVRTGALFRLAAARDRSRLFAFASDGSVVARDEWGDWGGRGPSWRTILPVRPARIFPQAPALSFVPDDLWIAGRDDVWAIGSYSGEPVMMRWEGAAWNTADDADGRRAMAREDIVAVYTDGDDVWAASTRRLGNARGHQGQLRRRRGERWTSVTTLARFPTALFGLGASDIWAAGVAGAMWHWDGARWHDVPTGTDDDLLALWGSRPDDVWAGGIDGALLRWDGRGWRRWQVPAAPNIGARSQRAAADTNVRSLAGSAGDDVWAVSGTELLHFDGRSWSRVPAPAAVDAVWAAGRNDLWVATHESRAALDRTARTPVGAGEDGDAIAGIFRWDGLVWEQSKREHPMLWRGRLVGIRGRDSGEIWAWGTHGLFEHYDGRRWSTVSAHIGTRAVLDVALGTGGAVWLAGTDELCHRHR